MFRGSNEVGNPADLSSTFHRISLTGAHRPCDGLVIQGSIPFVYAMREEAGVTDKTIEGLADVSITALWSPWESEDSVLSGLQFLAGFILPTGEAADQPLVGVAAPSVFQLGTGTFQLLLGAQYSGSVGDWSYTTRVDVSLPLNESNKGFRPTETFFWSTGIGRSLTDNLSARLSVDLSHGNEDEFHGAKIAGTGSTVVALRPSLVWQLNDNLAISASVALPVYREVNKTQMAAGTLWTLGVTKIF